MPGSPSSNIRNNGACCINNLTDGASDRRTARDTPALPARSPESATADIDLNGSFDPQGRTDHHQDHCRKPRPGALFPSPSSRCDAQRRRTLHPRCRPTRMRGSGPDSHGGDHASPALLSNASRRRSQRAPVDWQGGSGFRFPGSLWVCLNPSKIYDQTSTALPRAFNA